jgi:hypothetical protein
MRNAILANDLAGAARAAKECGYVTLHDALDLTLLAARKQAPCFEPYARAWMARFLTEYKPSMLLTSWIAEDLEKVAAREPVPFIVQESEWRLRRTSLALKNRQVPDEGEYVGYERPEDYEQFG